MIKPIALNNFDRDSEHGRQALRSKYLGFTAIGDNLALSKQYNAIYFRNDIVQVVRNQQKTGPLPGKRPQMTPDFMQGGKIEAGGRLVQQQGLRIVYQRSRDKQAAGFAGRKLVEPTICEVGGIQPLHGAPRCLFHPGCDVVVRPDANRAEEARKYKLAACDVARTLRHQIVADETDMGTQLENVPISLAEDFEARFGPQQGVALARDRLDQRGLAAAVWAKDSDVFPRLDVKSEAVQGEAIAALGENILEVN